jgi:hypothetical protein
MIVHGKVPKKHLKALDFFASKLITHQKRKHIEITVKYRKVIDELGTVYVDDYNVLGMPISFVIEVRQTDSEEEKLKTLAHEMVHVRQYIRGELNEEMSVWRGRKVDSDEIPYAEQPWEIEAESIAHKLYDEYISK